MTGINPNLLYICKPGQEIKQGKLEYSTIATREEATADAERRARADPSGTPGAGVLSATATLLEAEDLARHYEIKRGFMAEAATLRALAGVSFSLETGHTLAVVGESG